MTKDNIKQIIASIIVGACVAFFSTLFEGLASFMRDHSRELVSGGVTSFYHMAKTYKNV